MKIGSLKPAWGATRAPKRRGLGPASGLGGTAGRGHKGQRARAGAKIPRWFEGGQMPIQRRTPKRGFTSIHRVPYQLVHVGSLTRFAKGETVDRASLRARRLIRRTDLPVKLLADGEIVNPVQVALDAVSAAARAKVEAAGGTVTVVAPKRAPAGRPAGAEKRG